MLEVSVSLVLLRKGNLQAVKQKARLAPLIMAKILLFNFI